jgi:hypothetical protein
MIVIDKRSHGVSEMSFAKRHDSRQTLGSDRLHKSLGKRVQIRTPLIAASQATTQPAVFAPPLTPRSFWVPRQGATLSAKKQGATRGATLNVKASDRLRRAERPQHLAVVSRPTVLLVGCGGVSGTTFATGSSTPPERHRPCPKTVAEMVHWLHQPPDAPTTRAAFHSSNEVVGAR